MGYRIRLGALLATATLAGTLVVIASATAPADRLLAGSTVKLIATAGHGSGVHIGNGYVITAAHVATEGTTLSWLSDKGDRGAATLLWRNVAHDVALMRIEGWDTVASANLECRVPEVGENVVMRGNPLSLEHIEMQGRIAGGVTRKGPWAEAVPVDGSIAGGMSGGGVFDDEGDLVGINVGGMIQQVGFGGGPAGIGIIVPGSTVCAMLART